MQIKNVVIIGGGTSGWMSAALINSLMKATGVNVTLIESDAIGTIGVGEATIPAIVEYCSVVGITEQDLIEHCNATFKLGIKFENWGKLGSSYNHSFSDLGYDLNGLPFHQYYTKIATHYENFDQYHVNSQMMEHGRFSVADRSKPNSPLNAINYAYHMDATLFAKYLRDKCTSQGVHRIEGKVVKVNNNNSGIKNIELESGQVIAGDLWIDCSGFTGLLINKALGSAYEDWSHWLPCDSAWAVPCSPHREQVPYTRAVAMSNGWRWQIPTQTRTGNGYVFSSKYTTPEAAKQELLNSLEGVPQSEPRLIKFVPGKRTKSWVGNCVAVGLSSGFIEPLESTSIHLIQSALFRLAAYWPDLNFSQANIDQYNQETTLEIEMLRDFIIAHYHVTQRTDSEFWNYVRTMPVPKELTQKLALYKTTGRLTRGFDRLFANFSWAQVLHGQKFVAQSYHPIADVYTNEQASFYVKDVAQKIQETVANMPEYTKVLANLIQRE